MALNRAASRPAIAMNLQERLNLSGQPLFLMDGTAFIYRSFFAQRHLSRSDGLPTNALTLLTRVLLRILKQERPRYFLFVVDGKGGNFRKELYADYKANREAMPEELAVQLEPIMAMVQSLGLPMFTSSGCEADDCIASLAARFSPRLPIIIISGDKDLKQCLGNNVLMWDPAAREEKLLTAEAFEAESGVSPAQWPDAQALIGDSSDNIPGVPGIGPKTVSQIFKSCKNLEDIRDNLDKLNAKIRVKLEPHLDEMFLWRRLTTLRLDVCDQLTLADMRIQPIHLAECESLAKEYELTSLGREIARLALQERSQLDGPEQKVVASVAPGWSEPSPIETAAQLPACQGGNVALVWQRGLGKPLDIAIAGGDGVDSQGQEFLFLGKMADLCAWIVAARLVILPDYKELLVKSPSWQKFQQGKRTWRICDLGLCSWLLDPDDGDYSFKKLASKFASDAAACGPADLALNLGTKLLQQLKAQGLVSLYEDIELPLAPVLAQMQLTGFAIDPAAFRLFLSEAQGKIDALTAAIFDLAGEKFNLRSAQQLGDILYKKLGLPMAKLTQGGQPSTSQLTLEKLGADYPIVAKILEFRKLDKMRATYLDPLPRLMDVDNRIHSTFNQTATATGRLSSSEPNLQNIPVRGELGKRMRACFVPGPGNLLVAADYSQIELRILAHLSQDQHLLAAFRDGEDIHTSTAALIFARPQAEITADQRRMAKTINFGLLYGMGSRKLAQELKISLQEAKDFIDRYFAGLSGLKRFYENILATARQQGFVQTMAHRKRWLGQINSNNGQARAQAERQAVNTVIQGSAADIVKLAMIQASNDGKLRSLQAVLVLQVHDELLLEAPAANAGEAGARLATIMQSVKPGGEELTVPLLVDWGTGKNWGEAH